jgi:hypothetical protein
MELNLDGDDIRLLQRMLERILGELRAEIADTEKLDWRQSMHVDEDRLKAILDRLANLAAA